MGGKIGTSTPWERSGMKALIGLFNLITALIILSGLSAIVVWTIYFWYRVAVTVSAWPLG
jgi:hypothetical protein